MSVTMRRIDSAREYSSCGRAETATASGRTVAGACASACESAGSVMVDISAPPFSLLVRRVEEVGHQGVELLLGESLPEVRGHDPLAEALGDLGIGFDDRLADEGHVLALQRL